MVLNHDLVILLTLHVLQFLEKEDKFSIFFFAINPKKKIKSKINKTYVFCYFVYVIRHTTVVRVK